MWGSWSWCFSVLCSHWTSQTSETKGKWRVIKLFIEMSLRILFFQNMALCCWVICFQCFEGTWHYVLLKHPQPITQWHGIISQRNYSYSGTEWSYLLSSAKVSVLLQIYSDRSSKYTPWNKTWSSWNRGWNTTASIWILWFRNPFPSSTQSLPLSDCGSSELWYCTVLKGDTNILVEHAASVFKVNVSRRKMGLRLYRHTTRNMANQIHWRENAVQANINGLIKCRNQPPLVGLIGHLSSTISINQPYLHPIHSNLTMEAACSSDILCCNPSITVVPQLNWCMQHLNIIFLCAEHHKLILVSSFELRTILSKVQLSLCTPCTQED